MFLIEMALFILMLAITLCQLSYDFKVLRAGTDDPQQRDRPLADR